MFPTNPFRTAAAQFGGPLSQDNRKQKSGSKADTASVITSVPLIDPLKYFREQRRNTASNDQNSPPASISPVGLSKIARKVSANIHGGSYDFEECTTNKSIDLLNFNGASAAVATAVDCHDNSAAEQMDLSPDFLDGAASINSTAEQQQQHVTATATLSHHKQFFGISVFGEGAAVLKSARLSVFPAPPPPVSNTDRPTVKQPVITPRPLKNPLEIPEILLHIFSFLDTPLITSADPTSPIDFVKVDSIKYTITKPKLHSCVLVNKLWNACATKILWKHVRLGGTVGCKRLLSCLGTETGQMRRLEHSLAIKSSRVSQS